MPEFLYSNLYDSKGRMIGINGVGPKKYKLLQKGLREKLFCDNCEQLLNKNYEKPFFEYWIRKNPLPSKMIPQQEVNFTVPSYDDFRLFHLSVLFRAGISSLPAYSSVNLGKHAEILRQMILNRSIGDPTHYLLFGYAVIHHKTGEVTNNIITEPELRRFDQKIKCFSMIYGGMEWWHTCVSHRTKYIEDIALNPNGVMKAMAVPWTAIPAMHRVKNALRGDGA